MNSCSPPVRPWRLGAVSFLNARPLVYGLDATCGMQVTFEVPARLPGLLNSGAVDVALAPVVDLSRFHSAWRIVSDACIGCDGETLTVRVFSRVPPEEITCLHVDGDSHTSVALAMVVWNEMYGVPLRVTPLDTATLPESQAVLLIGDKVVTHRLEGFTHEIDLGGAWKTLTGLPFVFATWVRRTGTDPGDLAEVLARARDRGVQEASRIAAEQGPSLGWPVDLARRYFTECLRFTLTERHRAGLERFFELSRKWGILPSAPEMAPA